MGQWTKYTDEINKQTKYYDNGKVKSEKYWKNSHIHNVGGPAFIVYYENGHKKREEYLVDGMLHKVIAYYDNGSKKYEEYLVNGNQLKRVYF